MKKERKIKLSKMKIAKIDYLTAKGGGTSDTCITIEKECPTNACETDINNTCKTTTNTRNSDSLGSI